MAITKKNQDFSPIKLFFKEPQTWKNQISQTPPTNHQPTFPTSFLLVVSYIFLLKAGPGGNIGNLDETASALGFPSNSKKVKFTFSKQVDLEDSSLRIFCLGDVCQRFQWEIMEIDIKTESVVRHLCAIV